MNEILQKRIEEVAKKICCTDCPMKIIRNCKGCVARENAIKTGIFTLQNQWISMEEGLPEEHGVYFVLINSKVPRITTFTGTWNIGNNTYNITHWMPISSLEEGINYGK